MTDGNKNKKQHHSAIFSSSFKRKSIGSDAQFVLMLSVASIALQGPAFAADITHKSGVGTWEAASSWNGNVVPGKDDRAIISSGVSLVGFGGSAPRDLGSLLMTSTATLGTLGAPTSPAIRFYGTVDPSDPTGTARVAAVTEANRVTTFFQRSILANDVTFRASNAAGGGFQWAGLTALGPTFWGIDLAGHTATFDTVNAANTMAIVGPTFIIQGDGNVIKTGAGTLTFNNSVSTYTGFTEVKAGKLALTGAGSISSSSGLHNDGTFDIAGTTSGTSIKNLSGGTTGVVNLGTKTLTISNANGEIYAGSFAGTGALNISGNQILTGDSSAFSGTTMFHAGTLAVNGTLQGSLDVLGGATLKGNGTIGATTVRDAASIAPGNSIGTLTVNGTYTQQTGSTYQVELNPNSTGSDLIQVNGTATVEPGALLTAGRGVAGNYTVGSVYRVLNATGGVTGTYTLTDNGAVTAFLNVVDSYDANNVYLGIIQTRDIGAAVQTPNQAVTAEAIRGTDKENPLLNSATDAEARQALDQLSGAAHASVKGAMIFDSRYTRALAIDRLRDAFCTTGYSSMSGADQTGCATNPDRFAMWAQGFGSWGHSNGNVNAARIDRSSGGFVSGFDTAVAENWRVGVFTGYSHSNFSSDSLNASTASDNYHVGLYGGSQWGRIAARFGAAYTGHDITSNRSVALPGLTNRLRADYDAATAQVFGELGYQIEAGHFGLEPFVNLAYVNLHTDGFAEQGGATALISRSSDNGTAFTTLGMRASTDVVLGGVKARARGTLGWVHAYGDITPSSVMSFAGGNPFTVTGVPIATDAAVTEAGVDVQIARDTTIGISYNGQFGDNAVDQSVRGNLTVRF